MTPLDALKQRLITLVPLVDGETIFAGPDADLPATGTGFLVIRETGGAPPVGTHNEGFTALRRPSFQLMSHATDYSVAWALANAAYAASNASNVQIDDVFFLMIFPIQEPHDMPPDPKGRCRVVFNVGTYRRG